MQKLLVNEDFIQDLYHRYMGDPDDVDPSWHAYFEGIEIKNGVLHGPVSVPQQGIDAHHTLLMLGRLIESYRWRGHLRAKLDPLGLAKPVGDQELALDLLGARLGDTSIQAELKGELGLIASSLPRILERLEEIYCGSVGFEFMHVSNACAREWLRDAIESGWGNPSTDARRTALKRLIEAEEFEHFMHRRYPGKKRFGAEGAESLIAWLGAALDDIASNGAKTVVIGGTSRCRFNQMANIVGKPLGRLFAEFYGAPPFEGLPRISGDVAYHLGYSAEPEFGGKRLQIDYCHNPSHLEAINAVALGRTRALQHNSPQPETGQQTVWPILVHTDAAFAGQGVISEVFQLSGLQNYSVGGTLHIVINNQLGFTTDPKLGRTSTYCTDAAKIIGAPVFHVNADDVDAVVRTATIAAEYRRRFQADVVVDLVCYRRRGHNEADEPSFTQPRMYAAITAHPSSRRSYADALASAGQFSAAEENDHVARYREKLEEGFEQAKSWRPDPVVTTDNDNQRCATGINLARLRQLGTTLYTAPKDIPFHPRVIKILDERLAALASGKGIDWAMAESLAFGSLLQDGIGLRLSGQDTPRGAFSHRHYKLHGTDGEHVVSLFDSVANDHAAPCEIINSPLAEYATLGFEYGYSLKASQQLVVWEAQFGDFLNVGQTVVDQFISSGNDKWVQPSHLVMLLPHGLEGQGAEHSSARIERMLQLCAAENMYVANCTTPANYFHLLRRQGLERRKPLIVFTPKSLLRHRDATSALDELADATSFQPVIGPEAGSYKRIVLCSGKIYWALEAERRNQGLEHVGIVRIEQLYPFPKDALADVLRPHAGAEFFWCQEEPANMGAWSFVDRLIEDQLREIGSQSMWPRYIGRPANASPSIGTFDEHTRDQQEIVLAALG